MRILVRCALVSCFLLAASTMLRADSWSWEFAVGGVGYTENGTSYAIDFSTLPSSTLIGPSAYAADGVTFKTEDSGGTFGSPATTGDGWGAGLSNSTTGEYPTTQFLDFDFTSAAQDVTFNFNNFGNPYRTSGRGVSYYTVYYGDGTSQTVSLNNSNYWESFGTATPAGSNITEIQISNYTAGGPERTPEPTALSLLGTGLLGLFGLARRKLFN